MSTVPSEVSVELLCLSFFGIQSVFGVLEVLDGLQGLLQLLVKGVVFLSQYSVLQAELRDVATQLQVVMTTVLTELLHLSKQDLHTLHQSLQLLLLLCHTVVLLQSYTIFIKPMRGKLIQKHGPTQTAIPSRVSLTNLLNPVRLIPSLFKLFLFLPLVFLLYIYIGRQVMMQH